MTRDGPGKGANLDERFAGPSRGLRDHMLRDPAQGYAPEISGNALSKLLSGSGRQFYPICLLPPHRFYHDCVRAAYPSFHFFDGLE